MTIYILLEDGEFVSAYRTRKEAEKSARENDIRNMHIIETTFRGGFKVNIYSHFVLLE